MILSSRSRQAQGGKQYELRKSVQAPAGGIGAIGLELKARVPIEVDHPEGGRLLQSLQSRKDGQRGDYALSNEVGHCFQSLRHTAVSLLKDAGLPDAVVMALVGHASAAMSQRYTHVGKEALSRATGSLPEI
jgi:integrase